MSDSKFMIFVVTQVMFCFVALGVCILDAAIQLGNPLFIGCSVVMLAGVAWVAWMLVEDYLSDRK